MYGQQPQNFFNNGYNQQPVQPMMFGNMYQQNVNPAAPYESWLNSAVSDYLTMSVNSGNMSMQECNVISKMFYNNKPGFMTELGKCTNGFSIVLDSNSASRFVASIVEMLHREYVKQQNMQTQNTMYRNNFQQPAPMQMQPMQPVQPQQPIINNPVQSNFGARPRSNTATIQQYANNVVTQPQASDPIQSAVNNTQQNTTITENELNVKKTVKTIDVTAESTMRPICIKKDYHIRFNPDDRSTWPPSLLDKYIDIEHSDRPEKSKTCLKNLAIAEEYWRSKNITWPADNGFGIAVLLEQKLEARKYYSNSSLQQDKALTDYYLALPDTCVLANDNSSNIGSYSFHEGDKYIKKIYIMDIDHQDLVWNEINFLKACGNGSLKDLLLKGDGGLHSISPKDECARIALSVNYSPINIIYVPREVTTNCLSKIKDLCKKYSMEYEVQFKEMIKEVTGILYDLPKKYSNKIDTFITNELNNRFSRSFRHLSGGVIRAPYISSWINLFDLYENTNHNRLQISMGLSAYRKALATAVYNVLVTLTNDTVIDFNAEFADEKVDNFQSTCESIMSNPELKHYLVSKISKDLNATNMADSLLDDDKKATLLNVLDNISVLPIEKTVCITTVCMNVEVGGRHGELMFVPEDTHLTQLELLISYEFNMHRTTRDLFIIDQKDYTFLQDPVTSKYAYYKLLETQDRFIGYGLM